MRYNNIPILYCGLILDEARQNSSLLFYLYNIICLFSTAFPFRLVLTLAAFRSLSKTIYELLGSYYL